MNTVTSIHLFPEASNPPPSASLSPFGPVVMLSESVMVHLSSHDDPAAYLNNLAAQLIALAYEYTDSQHAAVTA